MLSKFDFGAGGGLVPYPIYEADEKTPLLVEPMTRDRIAIARAGGEGKVEETAGIAIWASVSDEVDAKIREQIQARVFPIRLKSEDWASGDTTWLLDVIAPSQKVATAVLANFKQVVKDKPVRIHPLVSQLVDPAVLEKMKVRPVGEAEGKTETA
ncbi:toxin-activating lysine-acyltransferase [uncultured Bradyrhizobium sp.]|uniref:toxin-activating lysine-acyltransferase n=1 Tax=uncultured Bradyrhizobium sp. TaxID=199684 RepID=UPI0035CB51B7